MTRFSPDQSQTSEAPPSEAVRAALERVAGNAEFSRSPRLQRFLRYVVDETLAGRGEALKEYVIAIEVFDRDVSYDPQTNSLVRVEASRLRSKLEKYNALAGPDEPVRISLPAGSYVPAFNTVKPEKPPADGAQPSVRSRHPVSMPAALIVLALAATATGGAAVWLWSGLTERRTEVEANESARQTAIAVLPLRNLSGNTDDDYLGVTMTDALVTKLAKQQSVRVISLTSALAYEKASRPLAELARKLDVSHVVEGSIIRNGASVKITAKLIDVATDRYLWAESYERDLSEILALQSDIARRIAGSLSDIVGGGATEPRTRAAAVDPEAQEAYLKGRYFSSQLTEEGFRKSVAYFKQAIAKSPNYPEAYSGMATCYCLLGGHGFELVDPREGMPAAKAAILEALRLDDSLAEAHAFLGIIRLKYEWDWEGAEQEFLHAIRLNPSYSQAHVFYSFFLEAMGRPDEAIREAELARTIDPLSRNVNLNLSWQYLRAGRLDDAQRQLERIRELQANFWGIYWGYGHLHRQKGRYAEAIKAFEKAVELGGGYALAMTDLGYTYAIAGRPAEARAVLEQLNTMAETSYVSPYSMATIHVGLGETDEAFVWLEKALEVRSRSLAWLEVAAEYDSVRGDPRFRALIKRVGLRG